MQCFSNVKICLNLHSKLLTWIGTPVSRMGLITKIVFTSGIHYIRGMMYIAQQIYLTFVKEFKVTNFILYYLNILKLSGIWTRKLISMTFMNKVNATDINNVHINSEGNRYCCRSKRMKDVKKNIRIFQIGCAFFYSYIHINST